jgi:hypothetical protein
MEARRGGKHALPRNRVFVEKEKRKHMGLDGDSFREEEQSRRLSWTERVQVLEEEEFEDWREEDW